LICNPKAPFELFDQMEKTSTVEKIALLQRSVVTYEEAIYQQRDKIRRLRAAGDRTGEAESALGHLESYHEALLEAISTHLDRLDLEAGNRRKGAGTHADRRQTRLPYDTSEGDVTRIETVPQHKDG
jgi:hypothetical protein